jgi:AcrR family transcriptional regulator
MRRRTSHAPDEVDPVTGSGPQVVDTARPSRDVIVEAAETLIASAGYRAVSIAAICKASGLPVGSVYHHFGSKAGVLAAVLERSTNRFYAELADLAHGEPTAERRLERYYEAAPGLLAADAHLFRVHLELLGVGDAALRARLDVNRELAAEGLAEIIVPVARRAGVADPAGVAIRLARFTMTYTRGAMAVAGPDGVRLRQEMAPLFGVVSAAIASQAAADERVGR